MDRVRMDGAMKVLVEGGEVEGLSPEVAAALLQTPLAQAKQGKDGTGDAGASKG